MRNFDFYSPTYSVFGKDREAETGRYVKRFGGSRVLVVYGGQSAKRSGLLDRILAGLKEAVAAFEEDDKPYMGAPKIVLDGHNYFATELCIVNEVPERYLYAGELTDQEKKYAFIDGSKYYTPNSDGVP